MPVLLQERHLLHARRACSQIQKGMFSNAEGHVLKYRRACSQIQKGPFFCLNTHILHSCGAKQIYIKIKYSSPSHDFHSPHPFPFHPHSTPFPSPAHSPLSVTPRTCSSVTLSLLAYNLFTRLPVNPSTCPLLIELVHLLPCLLSPPTCSLVSPSTRQLTMLLIELVHLLPCLFLHTTCSLVSPSTRQFTMLLSELVHLLPCLLIQLTCSLVHSLIRLLVNYFYHLTFLSVLVQNTATLILPFLSPTSTVKNITINNTSH